MLNSYLPIPQASHIKLEMALDIWQFSLNTPCTPDELAILSEDERTRASRFHFERHQRRFSVARVRLRQILARYLDSPPATLEFQYETHGKPYLASSLQFNLSHSKDLALLAVCLDHPVGIDIEFYSARPFLGIGRHLFSEKENQILINLPNALKPICFFHLWAQKEAVIKAVGTGLSYPTASIEVPTLPPTAQHLLQTLDGQPWKLDAFSPILGAQAAVCYHPSISTIRYGHYV